MQNTKFPFAMDAESPKVRPSFTAKLSEIQAEIRRREDFLRREEEKLAIERFNSSPAWF